MGLESVAAFWLVSLLLVITPGVDWAHAIAAGLRERSVYPAVAGLLSGHLLAILVVAAGVGALVAGTPIALKSLTIAGAIYLVWLGAITLRHPSLPVAAEGQSSTSPRRQIVKGLGVSGLNPKVYLLALALLPQFTDPDARWPIGVQIIVLGVVHVASCAVIYTVVGMAAQRVLRTRPNAARVVTLLSGAAMMVIGVALLIE